MSNDLEEIRNVHYCKCGHSFTFHNYYYLYTNNLGVDIFNTSCDECNCKAYIFKETIKKKEGDMLGFYNGKWMTFYKIRELQSSRKKVGGMEKLDDFIKCADLTKYQRRYLRNLYEKIKNKGVN